MNDSKFNVIVWLEHQIHLTIKNINHSPENEELLTRLDKYISMKKKYEIGIDHLGETIRVMESFASYIISQHPKKSVQLQSIVTEFLNEQYKRKE